MVSFHFHFWVNCPLKGQIFFVYCDVHLSREGLGSICRLLMKADLNGSFHLIVIYGQGLSGINDWRR